MTEPNLMSPSVGQVRGVQPSRGVVGSAFYALVQRAFDVGKFLSRRPASSAHERNMLNGSVKVPGKVLHSLPIGSSLQLFRAYGQVPLYSEPCWRDRRRSAGPKLMVHSAPNQTWSCCNSLVGLSPPLGSKLAPVFHGRNGRRRDANVSNKRAGSDAHSHRCSEKTSQSNPERVEARADAALCRSADNRHQKCS